MDIETLKEFSADALRFGVDYLKERGNLRPMFMIFSPAGMDVINANLTSDAPGDRDAFLSFIRGKVIERGAYAIAHVSDAWIAAVREDHPQLALAQSGRYNTAQLQAMGIAVRREAILVSLETPIYHQLVQQFYRRGETGIVLEEKVERNSSHPGPAPTGRIFGFFPQTEAIRA